MRDVYPETGLPVIPNDFELELAIAKGRQEAQSKKKIYKIDASLLVQSGCMLRARRILVEGYSEKLLFNDTLYGVAFHKFTATMFETGGDIGQATFKAQEKFSEPCIIREGKKHLTIHHLLKTCFDWWEWYKKDNFEVLMIDGKPAVEVDFAIPFYEDDDYIVLLTGTIDKIGKFRNGCYGIPDYKVHSLWSVSKGNSTYWEREVMQYLKQYELSTQLIFYVYCLKLKLSREPDGALSKLLSNTPIGSCIDGVFLSSSEPTKFKRSELRIPKQEELDKFDVSLRAQIQRIIEYTRLHKYNRMDGLVIGACNDHRFPCKFYKVCAAPDDTAREFLLKNEYKQQPYDPLKFSK